MAQTMQTEYAVWCAPKLAGSPQHGPAHYMSFDRADRERRDADEAVEFTCGPHRVVQRKVTPWDLVPAVSSVVEQP